MIRTIRLLTLLFFISIDVTAQESNVLVTETTVKIPARSTEELYFGFAKGDEIIINCQLVN